MAAMPNMPMPFPMPQEGRHYRKRWVEPPRKEYPPETPGRDFLKCLLFTGAIIGIPAVIIKILMLIYS